MPENLVGARVSESGNVEREPFTCPEFKPGEVVLCPFALEFSLPGWFWVFWLFCFCSFFLNSVSFRLSFQGVWWIFTFFCVFLGTLK